MNTVLMRLAVVFATCGLLSGCIGMHQFQTYYDQPVPAQMARSWHVVGVDVTVPGSLTVSESHEYEPEADIVWREDPIGDRRPQVQKILSDAILKGAAGLHGPRAVRLVAVTRQFHAITFETEALNMAGVGVHNVRFSLAVVDARSGATLYGPTEIDATFPAKIGPEMIEARLHGETQKSQIIDHVARTIAGWLGVGPDMRMGFVRSGR